MAEALHARWRRATTVGGLERRTLGALLRQALARRRRTAGGLGCPADAPWWQDWASVLYEALGGGVAGAPGGRARRAILRLALEHVVPPAVRPVYPIQWTLRRPGRPRWVPERWRLARFRRRGATGRVVEAAGLDAGVVSGAPAAPCPPPRRA